MFAIILIVSLMVSGLLWTNLLVSFPSELIRTLHLPTWLNLTAIVLVFSWFLGED